MRDPRLYQIGVLSLLLFFGRWHLGFEINGWEIQTVLCTAILTQALATRLWSLPAFDPRSALISGLSICLLLRSDALWVYILATFVAILSKFLLRFHKKHLFNPTAFGIVIALLTGQAWVAAGQWGSLTLIAFFVSCLGILVVQRAARWDVSLAFLGGYGGLLMMRALWLGDPMAIFWHQIQNGALILFTFFMISDPKTTPNSRLGRLLFALIVAMGSLTVQFGLYRENGLFYSLVLSSLIVPLLDRCLPGPQYRWPTQARLPQPVVQARRSYEAIYT